VNPERSIVVFTLHKSASMFIHKQCEMLCSIGGIDYHSPNVPASRLDARMLLTDPGVWEKRRGCIAPVRFFVRLPRFDDFNIILHLRDPRDVLVSMFYSYCFIHPGEIPADTGYRREVASRGIDAFVLDKASGRSADYRGDYGTGGHVEDLIGDVSRRYRDYVEGMFGKPNVIFLKYEDMVTDYRHWLERFLVPFRLTESSGVLEQFSSQATTFFPKRQHDIMAHVRHVAPGDYRNKLKPATIGRLNDIFAETLDCLGYAK
jgi:hypothetical protein